VHDLAEAELCYAPQFGAAKDPVNLAGMLAQNVLNGDMPVADWLELDRAGALLLDVREPDEFAGGHIPNAINLPLSQLRSRYVELPKDRDIWLCCAVGQRAYYAARFLHSTGIGLGTCPAAIRRQGGGLYADAKRCCESVLNASLNPPFDFFASQ
jgi:rhodanese-related sulfurtransferase